MRITSPPFPISLTQPLLSSTLLEVLYTRAKDASVKELTPLPNKSQLGGEPNLSEQAVLVLALVESLPSIPNDILEEWLPLAAESVTMIKDQDISRVCKKRFWDILSNGEMDVSRAAIGFAWWNTRGGREMLLHGHQPEKGPYMSGALQEESKL